jgi:hypothetical protein
MKNVGSLVSLTRRRRMRALTLPPVHLHQAGGSTQGDSNIGYFFNPAHPDGSTDGLHARACVPCAQHFFFYKMCWCPTDTFSYASKVGISISTLLKLVKAAGAQLTPF